ncbi:MAG TPA: ROK family protein [Ardenticatenaceae bacterium]|nr:ROK family protein [Ardenticatenaceae bacterium]
MSRYVVGVDLGGTHLRAALVDDTGTIIGQLKRRTMADEGPERVFENLADAIIAVSAEMPRKTLLGVGVAAPGPVDTEAGVVHAPPNLPGWGIVPLAEILSRRTGLPIRVGNDANLAAVGEHTFGAGVGLSNLIYLTISTGIGGGVIADNRLLLGQRGLAAELGHILIVPHGPICSCGLRGHLEALAAGPAIAEHMAGLLRAGLTSSVQPVNGQISAIEIVKAAQEGDSLACQVIGEAGTFIGRGIASMVHCFAPQRIVIGGGVSNAGDLLLKPIQQSAYSRVMPAYRDTFDIVLTALGDDVGLLGAAGLALSAFGQRM